MTDPRSFPFPVCPAGEPPVEYAQVRQEPTLPRVRMNNGREALLVTRYRDVKHVLSDSRFSRSAFTGGALFSRTTESLPLITTDAPEHSRRRSAVAHAFTGRRVRAMRPMVRELAERQLAEITAGPPPVDLVNRFTVPFTLGVICRILGVPERDMHLFKPWVDPMMSVGRFPADEVARSHQELHAYFAGFVDVTQAAIDQSRPAPGLVAEMLAPHRPERRLSRTEVVTLAAGLLVAGYETTSNEMAAAIHQLLRRPALHDRVRRHPDRIGPVVEELLRFLCGNGTGGVPHVATVDVPLPDGVVVPAGEVVVPIPDAANRDPAVFAEPDRLRADRGDNPHVAFGYGPHYCLGAELARMEMCIGISALVCALPGLRIAVAEEELSWRTDMFVRGLWELPVTW